MSVLIKGMEMPKEGTVIAIYKLDGKFYASVHGTELCPLIPVPSHGNLIEKHDVFKLISAFPEIDKLLTVEFMTALYNLPTIIPAEEKKYETNL